jgi:hypothetical protein
VRFIQEQEDEQKEALYASERANNALKASASQYPRSAAYLEQTRHESDRSLSKTLPSFDLQDLNLFLDELLVTENIDPKKTATTTISSRYLL